MTSQLTLDYKPAIFIYSKNNFLVTRRNASNGFLELEKTTFQRLTALLRLIAFFSTEFFTLFFFMTKAI